MKIPKTLLVLCLSALVILLGVPLARAVRPLYAPFAVVAGSQYTIGYKDGSFNMAKFNQPLGLAVSDDGTRLFVADSLNNRIRVIHLDQDNEVGTIAGQTLPGNLDGPVSTATFHEPRGVLYLPGDTLVVNDFVNQSLRFIDLKAGMVTTYRGDPLDGSAPDTAKPAVLLSGIKDMAYLSSAKSILFTQPEAGLLNALDLGTGKVNVVLKADGHLPHPSALWIQGEKIYVADQDLLGVYSMDWAKGTVINLQSAGTPKDKVLSLASSDNTLYGMLKQNGYPLQRFLLDARYSHPTPCALCQACDTSNGMVLFNNNRGDFIPPEKYYNESIQPFSPWAGLVPDPSAKRRFFFSIPNANLIVTVRDLFGKLGYSSLGVLGGEYPAEKPKNTYRILLCGDCRTTDTDAFLFPTDSHPVIHATEIPFFPENLSLAPQVEHELNFNAALDDNPMRYEFLNGGHHGDLIFWPTIEVPPKAKALDIDQVMIFSPNMDGYAFSYYFRYNLTPDGIPQSPPDPEYLLKPPLERIPAGNPRKFYDYCKAKGWVTVKNNNLEFDDKIYGDPMLRDMMVDFLGKPWDLLNRKLSAIKTSSGKPVKLLILFGYQGTLSGETYKPSMYKEAADRYKIPYYDLDPELNTLALSYFPMTGTGHLDPDGAIFFGKLLAHVLPQENLIPWPAPGKKTQDPE